MARLQMLGWLGALAVICNVIAAKPAIAVDAAAQPSGAISGVWTGGPSTAESAALDELGVGWARVTITWSTVEPNNGVFNWSALDQQMANAAGGGRRTVLALVRDAPAWAAAVPCALTNTNEWQQLASFTSALARRYKGVVWQFFNEPDNTNVAFDLQFGLGGCFGTAAGGMPTPTGRANYAHALEAASAAIRAADPTAQIATGGVASGLYVTPTGGRFDQAFLPGVMAQLSAENSLASVDYMAVHYFSSQAGVFAATGTDLLGRLTQLRQDIQAVGLRADQLKPVIADELSYTDTIGISTSDPNDPFNVRQRAYVDKLLARAAAGNVRAAFWFLMQDSPGGLGNDNAYGLKDRGGNPKPAYAAVRYFNSVIKSPSQFAGTLQLGGVSPKLEGYEFATSSASMLQIVWNQLDGTNVGYSPAGTVVSVTDPVGAPIAFTGNTVWVGEPRFITYTPNPAAAPTGGSGQQGTGGTTTPAQPSASSSGGGGGGSSKSGGVTIDTSALAGGGGGGGGSTGGAPSTSTLAAVALPTNGLIATLASPVRLADTSASGAPIPSGSSRCFQVSGLNGIPADSTAVVLNVTATGYGTNGWLTVYPGGQAPPPTSTVSFSTGEYAVANGTITQVGAGNQVCVSVGSVDGSQSTAHVILDATGFLPTGAASQLAMLQFPLRVTDTHASNAPIASGSSQCFQITGLAGIPSGAAAVVLNVTASEYTDSGWLTVYPNGQDIPATSTLNFDKSQYAVANNAIVRVGDAGQVCVNVGTLNAGSGGSHVVLDAIGYLTSSGLAKLAMLTAPERVVDTRPSDAGAIGAGSTRCFPVAGVADIPASATAVAVNLTAVGYDSQGWLTAYPAGSPLPATSSLNFDPSAYALANGTIVGLGSNGQLCINVGTLPGSGSSHVLVDVVGYLTP